jgi:hypothetical protein
MNSCTKILLLVIYIHVFLLVMYADHKIAVKRCMTDTTCESTDTMLWPRLMEVIK